MAALLVAILGLAAGVVVAQDIDRPNALRDVSAERAEAVRKLAGEIRDRVSEETEVSPSADLELLPELKGIVLIPLADDVNADAITLEAPAVEGIGMELPPSVIEEASPFLGEALTLNGLTQINAAISRGYGLADRPVVDVYAPEQDISGGVVQFVVVEGKRGAVKVEGEDWTDEERLANWVTPSLGQIIRESVLQRDLDWMNENPFRQVNMVFEPGADEGSTDIVLQVAEVRPWRVFGGVANTGLDLTGETEFNAGFIHGNLFDREHVLSYQYSSDIDFETIQAHSFLYQIPLPWRHRLDLLGAYVSSDVGQVVDGEAIDIGGESMLASMEYIIPQRPFWKFDRQELRFGIDFKSTNNDLEFGGAQVFAETAAVLQFRTGYLLRWEDKWGPGLLDADLVFSPGGLIGDNDDQSFSTLRSGASADYVYGEVNFEKLVRLPQEWELAFSGSAQYSPSRLISSEQLLAGGYRSVRGFEENAVRGDSGIVFTTELFAPPFSPARKFRTGFTDEMQLGVFHDVAWLQAADRGPGEPDITISSAGLSLNYRFSKHGTLRASYGWQLGTSGVNGLDEGGKFHFGATFLY